MQVNCAKRSATEENHHYFSTGKNSDIDGNWRALRAVQPNGPLVNSEYYPGWLTHWQESLAQVSTKPVVDSLMYVYDFTSN